MEHNVFNNQDASASVNSNGFNVDSLPFRAKTLGVQFVSAGFNGTATLTIQHSNIDDDSYYQNIPDASFSIGAGADDDILTPFVDIGMKYYRASLTNATNTAGTLDVVFNFN